jgi:hypothetical protein
MPEISTSEHTKDFLRSDLEASFLEDFAPNSVLRTLTWLDRTRRQAPTLTR